MAECICSRCNRIVMENNHSCFQTSGSNFSVVPQASSRSINIRHGEPKKKKGWHVEAFGKDKHKNRRKKL